TVAGTLIGGLAASGPGTSAWGVGAGSAGSWTSRGASISDGGAGASCFFLAGSALGWGGGRLGATLGTGGFTGGWIAAGISTISTRTGGGTGTAVRGSSRSRTNPIRERNVRRTDAAVSQGSLVHGSSSKRIACTVTLWLMPLLGLDREEEVLGARIPRF